MQNLLGHPVSERIDSETQIRIGSTLISLWICIAFKKVDKDIENGSRSQKSIFQVSFNFLQSIGIFRYQSHENWDGGNPEPVTWAPGCEQHL